MYHSFSVFLVIVINSELFIFGPFFGIDPAAEHVLRSNAPFLISQDMHACSVSDQSAEQKAKDRRQHVRSSPRSHPSSPMRTYHAVDHWCAKSSHRGKVSLVARTRITAFAAIDKRYPACNRSLCQLLTLASRSFISILNRHVDDTAWTASQQYMSDSFCVESDHRSV